MRTTRYTGTFTSHEGHTFTLKVNCSGFLQAFFLLIAEVIRQGKHYQLKTIVDDDGHTRQVDDILKCSELLK